MTSLRGFIESARAELPAQTLARWASVFFSLSVLTFLISLALSQAFLTLASIVFAVHVLRHKICPVFPPIKLPLALFCLLSIFSVFWAENPTVGWFAVRKLVLFLILLLTVNLVTSTQHLKVLYQVLFLESGLSGIIAIAQFVAHYRSEQFLHPGEVYIYMTNARAHGFMGHWMNFGGQQMLVFVALSAFVLLAGKVAAGDGDRWSSNPATGDPSPREAAPSLRSGQALKVGTTAIRAREIWWLVWGLVATSIILNFTRGVWLGCFIACIYLVARWNPLWLWVLPVLLIAGYFASPDLIRRRLESVRHPVADPSLAIRFEMWRVGWRMIEQHPLVGVGPNNIPETYTLYLPAGEIPIVGYREHLHNDVLQLGAERGLPCLAAWVWLVVALGWHTLRVRRHILRDGLRNHQIWVADAAFACLLAFAAEGCFEFNFGTSPVLMVFLFIASTPFVAEMRVRRQESADRN